MTERTGGKRPDYKVLGATGEYVQRNTDFRSTSSDPESENAVHSQNASSNSDSMDDFDENDTDFLVYVMAETYKTKLVDGVPKTVAVDLSD